MTKQESSNLKVLGFDIGIASIGWAYVCGGELKDCGVRIFTKAENPKDGSSLALPRREARGARRRLARRKVRLYAIKDLVCKEFDLNLGDFLSPAGELPKAYITSKDTKSPYELRAEALNQVLTKAEFARVILHIAKHRGYGNKHAKESTDSENGKVKKAMSENENAIVELAKKEAKKYGKEEEYEKYKYTIGEYLYNEFYEKGRRLKDDKGEYIKNDKGEFVRDKSHFDNVRNKAESYARCVSQKELQDELTLIFKRQRELGFKFKDATYKIYDENRALKELDFESAVLQTAFLQRPLKSFADKVGKCTFFADEPRAPKDSLSAIEFRALGHIIGILINIDNRISEGKEQTTTGEIYTTKENIHKILQIVLDKGEIKYKKLREMICLPESTRFYANAKLDYTKSIKEAENKDFLKFDNLTKFKKALGGSFEGFTRAELDSIAVCITLIKDKIALFDTLKSGNPPKDIKLNESQKVALNSASKKLNESQCSALSELNFDKFIDLSFKALEAILPFMRGESLTFKDECKRYDEAWREAGLVEVAKKTQKGDKLPPLIEYEPNLANPVVARALSEYRKVCNALLEKYRKEYKDENFKVHKIHIELSREVGKSYLTRKQYEKEQDENLKKINEAKERLKQYEIPINAQNVIKARLFIEQGEYCAYSKVKITREHLRDPKALEIDHIYPYSRSFDDSYMNKVLVFTKENQHKRNQTPFEAFGKDKEKWEMIKSFAKNFLPHQKYKRVVNENFADKENEFKDRNLNDTKYMARLALNYTKDNLKFEKLSENECTISGEKGSKIHCEAVSGTLTTNLRRIWEFENKSRDNHLHHALDAIIIAHINASMVKQFSEYYKRKNELKLTHFKKRDKLKWQLHNNEISQDEYDKQDEETTKAYNKEKELNNEWIKEKFCLPYEDFHKVVEEKISQIFVSKPPRKRARGALHKETFSSIDSSKLAKTYGGKVGVERAIKLGKIRQIGSKVADNGAMVRVDIFRHKLSGKFYGVPIYTMDFALGILPNKAVVGDKDKSGVIKEWLEMDSSYKFCFSLFKDDLILVQKKEMSKAELCYFVSFTTSGVGINFEKHDSFYVNLSENQRKLFTAKERVKGSKKAWKDKTPEEREQLEKARKIIGGFTTIEDLKVFEKWQVSPLGAVKPAEYKEREDIKLKSSPKDSKKKAQNEL
ncbi:type II CRISPR RNA-guided endonuclease Cas9 [Helicobacter sp. 23-1046]